MKDLIDLVVAESGNVNLEKAIEGYHLPDDVKSYMLKTPYFRYLAAHCKIQKTKKVLELGTCTGASAMSLALYAQQVDTFDVTNDKIHPSLENKNITFNYLTKPEHCLDIEFNEYDLIFVDIDHEGEMESQIHKELEKSYEGIVYYDDVMLNKKMQKFWSTIKQEKMVLPWHFSGFGVVKY